MGSVSEAKYTYWHTIVNLAEASEMPKTEWCRKNCISIKTFNHYEGIFRRQEARKVGSVLKYPCAQACYTKCGKKGVSAQFFEYFSSL